MKINNVGGWSWRKMTRRAINTFLRRKIILLANILLNNKAGLYLIGKVLPIKSIFVAYPATEDYALAYVAKKHREYMRWSPWLAGFFKQGKKWGLTTVVSSVEENFLDPANYDNLKKLVEATDRIRKSVGADQMTFAGILAGVLYSKDLVADPIEADVTVEAVVRAEKLVRENHCLPPDTNVIVLGGLGFIGRRLVSRLDDRKVYSVDLHSGNENSANLRDWPHHLKGKTAIVVNITRKRAISYYVDLFWPGLILLNEAYPEPKISEVVILKDKGVTAYHVVGIEGMSVPSFPKAYHGAIPCCASWISEDMKVRLGRLC